MVNTSSLLNAISECLPELRDLVGRDWNQFEERLLHLLRDLDDPDGNHEQVRKQIDELFARYPAANMRLCQILEVQSVAARKTVRRGVRKESSQVQRYTEVPVYYATDRKRTGHKKLSRFYSGDRGELHFGKVVVSIPDDHRMGALEKPSIWRLQFRASPDKHVLLMNIEILAREQFVKTVRTAIDDANQPEILTFVHGYNVDFEDAARRAAQVAYDLNFTGVPMLYSWPSEGNAAKYTVDEANIGWTRPHLEEFLRMTLTEFGARKVHVIAHSMGNRALAELIPHLDRRALPGDAATLQQIIFAAPDIDAQTFASLAKHFYGGAERFTLYASAKDKALGASQLVHKYPRAGDAGQDLLVVDTVDTIDASDLDTNLLAHSYWRDNRSIITDIFELIRRGTDPSQRVGLSEQSKNGLPYWVVRP